MQIPAAVFLSRNLLIFRKYNKKPGSAFSEKTGYGYGRPIIAAGKKCCRGCGHPGMQQTLDASLNKSGKKQTRSEIRNMLEAYVW